MATTPGELTPRGYPTPPLGDIANGPQQIADLADAVDADVTSVSGQLFGALELFGTSGAYFGQPLPEGTKPLWQAFCGNYPTDNGGNAQIAYPQAFPNGVIAVIPILADLAHGGYVTLAPPSEFPKSLAKYVVRNYTVTGAPRPNVAAVPIITAAVGW